MDGHVSLKRMVMYMTIVDEPVLIKVNCDYLLRVSICVCVF